MKNLRFFMIMLFMAAGFYAHGQNAGKDSKQREEDPYKIIFKLQNEKKDLESDTVKLNKSVRDLQQQLRKERESVTRQDNKKLNDSIKTLNGKIASLQKDTTLLVQLSQEQLSNQEKAFQEQRAADAEKISGLEADVNSLRDELSKLKNFKILFLKELATSVDEKWMKLPYSMIDESALNKDLDLYKEFADSDAGVREAFEKLVKLSSELQAYKEAKICVSSPYDKEKIAQAKQKLSPYAGKDGEKGKEMDNLIYQLNVYRINLKIFQDLIKDIDTEVAKRKTHAAGWPFVEIKINTKEAEDETVTCIKSVQWLSGMYDEYYKQLKKDCKADNSARNTIMKITAE